MGRTNELRKLVKSILSNEDFIQAHGIKGVWFEVADEENMYPHITFQFDQINTGDLYRHDLSLIIDLYDKGTSAHTVESMADAVEDMFNAKNLPQESILPTFYIERRNSVMDEDKMIRHRQIEIVIQNYEEE